MVTHLNLIMEVSVIREKFMHVCYMINLTLTYCILNLNSQYFNFINHKDALLHYYKNTFKMIN